MADEPTTAGSPAPASQQQVERARIFLTTGTYVDIALVLGWQMLVANILQNRGLMTDEMWIPERTIKAIVRNPGADVTDPDKIGDNVVPLRPVTGK